MRITTARKIICIVVAALFLVNDICFGLGTMPGSTQQSTKDGMYAAAQRLLAVGRGQGGINFDESNVSKKFDGSRALFDPSTGVEYIGYASKYQTSPVSVDYENPPTGWKNNPILKETNLIKALETFRNKEARIPADRLEIKEGWFLVDEDRGELPIARIERMREGKHVLIIHTKFVRMWNHIRENDVWFELYMGENDRRTVSAAWGIFYRLAKHEMAELSKLGDTFKSAGHISYNPEVLPQDDETLANEIGGNYALVNDAIWLWFLGSYCFTDRTRYDNKEFLKRIDWFFDSPEARALKLNLEFPNLVKDPDKRMIARAFAFMINHDFFNRTSIHGPKDFPSPVNPEFKAEYEKRLAQREALGIKEAYISATGSADETAKAGLKKQPIIHDVMRGINRTAAPFGELLRNIVKDNIVLFGRKGKEKYQFDLPNSSQPIYSPEGALKAILVTERNNHRIQYIPALIDETGKIVFDKENIVLFGEVGKEKGQFNSPRSSQPIYSPEGALEAIIVTELGNDRIQYIPALIDETGKIVFNEKNIVLFGEVGKEKGQFYSPNSSQPIYSPEGALEAILVTELDNDRIQYIPALIDETGKIVFDEKNIVLFGKVGKEKGQFNSLGSSQIISSPDGTITAVLVTEWDNHRIQLLPFPRNEGYAGYARGAIKGESGQKDKIALPVEKGIKKDHSVSPTIILPDAALTATFGTKTANTPVELLPSEMQTSWFSWRFNHHLRRLTKELPDAAKQRFAIARELAELIQTLDSFEGRYYYLMEHWRASDGKPFSRQGFARFNKERVLQILKKSDSIKDALRMIGIAQLIAQDIKEQIENNEVYKLSRIGNPHKRIDDILVKVDLLPLIDKALSIRAWGLAIVKGLVFADTDLQGRYEEGSSYNNIWVPQIGIYGNPAQEEPAASQLGKQAVEEPHQQRPAFKEEPGQEAPPTEGLKKQSIIHDVMRGINRTTAPFGELLRNIDKDNIVLFGERGDAEGQFIYPHSSQPIYSRDGVLKAILVTDMSNHRLHYIPAMIDEAGKIVFDKKNIVLFGKEGTGEGQFSHPVSSQPIYSSDGALKAILVTDMSNHRIHYIPALIDEAGKIVLDKKNIVLFGERGGAEGQFLYPGSSQPIYSRDGVLKAILVADWGNHRIHYIPALIDKAGKIVFDKNNIVLFGERGGAEGQFDYLRSSQPIYSRDGVLMAIVVTDEGNNRIHYIPALIDEAGKIVFDKKNIVLFGKEGTEKGQFNHPVSSQPIYSSDGALEAIIVTDTGNNRIHYIPVMIDEAGKIVFYKDNIVLFDERDGAKGQFDYPSSFQIISSPDGTIMATLVTEWGNHRIQFLPFPVNEGYIGHALDAIEEEPVQEATPTESQAPIDEIKKVNTPDAPYESGIKEPPLINFISDYILQVGLNEGPGAVELSSDATENIYKTVELLHDSQIEIFIPQSFKLTEHMKKVLKGIGKREGRDAIQCREYNGEQHLLTLLQEAPPLGVKRMVLSEYNGRGNLMSIANSQPEIFRFIRLLSVTLPRDYQEMESVVKTVHQAKMMTIAILARLFENDKTPMVETLLKGMLRECLDVDDEAFTRLVNELGMSDEDINRLTLNEVVHRIAHLLGKPVRLVEKIGREIHLMKVFWMAA